MTCHFSRDVERTEYLLNRNDEANGVDLTMVQLADNEVNFKDFIFPMLIPGATMFLDCENPISKHKCKYRRFQRDD